MIDAYNLLHAEKPPALAGLGEVQLCRLLDGRGFAQPQRPEAVTLVCDGRPKPHSLDPAELTGMTLQFSGSLSADAIIIRHINQCSSPRRLTVVSNDREIMKAARRRRARPRSCESFLNALAKAVDRPTTHPSRISGKPQVESLGEHATRAWLRAFGVEDDES